MNHVETDIELLPFTGNKDDSPGYNGGSRLFVELNRAPSDEWEQCFAEAVEAHLATGNMFMRIAAPAVERRVARVGMCLTVAAINAAPILATVRQVVERANEVAKGRNAKEHLAGEQKRKADEDAERVAFAIRESLRGK